MSVKETFKKKSGSVIAGVALGLAALSGNVKGETAEAKETSRPDKDAITATVNESEQRQQQLRAAILSGATQEEFVKYVDFPPFIPVTKDGQFDKARAKECSEKLVPYLKVLSEKRETMDAANAYKAFVETTGQKNVSYKEFKSVMDVAEKSMLEYQTEQGKRHNPRESFMAAAIAAGAACALFGLSFGARVARDKLLDCDSNLTTAAAIGCFGVRVFSFLGVIVMGAASVIALEVGTLDGTYNLLHPYAPKDAIYQTYAGTYQSYVDQVTKPYVEEKKNLDQEKAKQQRAAERAAVQKFLDKKTSEK